MDLPAAFCWTKYGTEAGEEITTILARKEQERRLNDGRFLWGIGSSIKPSLRHLIGRVTNPPILFSPMRSRPARVDVAPDTVVAWDVGIGMDGERYQVSARHLVTSRYSNPGRAHYALVCWSDRPLVDGSDDEAWLDHSHLRNVLGGTCVGSSQVTAVVEHQPANDRVGRRYPVAIQAELHPPFLLQLHDPRVVPSGTSDVNSST